eukprot:350078-Chlamydomonas_euryale.AAC.3
MLTSRPFRPFRRNAAATPSCEWNSAIRPRLGQPSATPLDVNAYRPPTPPSATPLDVNAYRPPRPPSATPLDVNAYRPPRPPSALSCSVEWATKDCPEDCPERCLFELLSADGCCSQLHTSAQPSTLHHTSPHFSTLLHTFSSEGLACTCEIHCATALGRSATGKSHHPSHSGWSGFAWNVGICRHPSVKHVVSTGPADEARYEARVCPGMCGHTSVREAGDTCMWERADRCGRGRRQMSVGEGRQVWERQATNECRRGQTGVGEAGDK